MSEPSEPWALVAEWLPANDDPERPQMTLATVRASGEPDARTVLLTEFDGQGFYFHTDALSRKAASIVANPAVALSFLWPGFSRQLVVQGRAEVAPAAEIAAAYRSRSPYLQQLAWLNTFEYAQAPDEERRARWAAFAESHTSGFEQPDNWIGFLVRPSRMTFWTCDQEAASRRLEYRATSGGWTVAHLPG
ncbi:pyridoxamine 5'-phosphate oxidase family protein [Lacisediminihabitans sp.]|uniref:pyridoxamine 5'-phosphate oxidase family protein n=1 Tax=Lacisediminihabitans sp. TaxID=2787631 RepID=UPI00374DD884